MEILNGIITNISDGYDEIVNTFTIKHNIYEEIFAAPYSITKKINGGYEQIEVPNVVFYRDKIVIYFGDIEIGNDDEFAYSFSIIEDSNSRSSSFSWEYYSQIACNARPYTASTSEEIVVGFPSVDFMNGKIQRLSLSGDTVLYKGNILNMSYGDDFMCVVKTNGNDFRYSSLQSGESLTDGTLAQSSVIILRAVQLDDLYVTIQENL